MVLPAAAAQHDSEGPLLSAKTCQRTRGPRVVPVWPPGHGKLVSGRRLGLSPARVSIGKWAISIMKVVDGLRARALSLSRYEQPLDLKPILSNRALSLLQLLLCVMPLYPSLTDC